VQGGAFEYVTGVRAATNEKNRIADILDGDCSRVLQLPFTPARIWHVGENCHRNYAALLSSTTRVLQNISTSIALIDENAIRAIDDQSKLNRHFQNATLWIRIVQRSWRIALNG